MHISGIFRYGNGSIGKNQSISPHNRSISPPLLILELQVSRHRIVDLVAIGVGSRTVWLDNVVRWPLREG